MAQVQLVFHANVHFTSILAWPRIQPEYFTAESGSAAQDDCPGNSTAIFPFPVTPQLKKWKKWKL